MRRYGLATVLGVAAATTVLLGAVAPAQAATRVTPESYSTTATQGNTAQRTADKTAASLAKSMSSTGTRTIKAGSTQLAPRKAGIAPPKESVAGPKILKKMTIWHGKKSLGTDSLEVIGGTEICSVNNPSKANKHKLTYREATITGYSHVVQGIRGPSAKPSVVYGHKHAFDFGIHRIHAVACIEYHRSWSYEYEAATAFRVGTVNGVKLWYVEEVDGTYH